MAKTWETIPAVGNPHGASFDEGRMTPEEAEYFIGSLRESMRPEQLERLARIQYEDQLREEAAPAPVAFAKNVGRSAAQMLTSDMLKAVPTLAYAGEVLADKYLPSAIVNNPILQPLRFKEGDAIPEGFKPGDIVPPEHRGLFKAGAAIEGGINKILPVDEYYQDSFWVNDVGQGIGSMAGFWGAGIAANLAKRGTTALAKKISAGVADNLATKLVNKSQVLKTPYTAAEAKGVMAPTTLGAQMEKAALRNAEDVLGGLELSAKEKAIGKIGGFVREGAVPGTLGGATSAGGAYEEARQAGASPEDATKVALVAFAGGSLEGATIQRMFARWASTKTAPGLVGRNLVGGAGKAGEKTVLTGLKDSALIRFANMTDSALEESGQELLQTWMGNLAAQKWYDPTRSWDENMARAGGSAGFSAAIFGPGGSSFQSAAETAKQHAARRIAIDSIKNGYVSPKGGWKNPDHEEYLKNTLDQDGLDAVNQAIAEILTKRVSEKGKGKGKVRDQKTGKGIEDIPGVGVKVKTPGEASYVSQGKDGKFHWFVNGQDMGAADTMEDATAKLRQALKKPEPEITAVKNVPPRDGTEEDANTQTAKSIKDALDRLDVPDANIDTLDDVSFTMADGRAVSVKKDPETGLYDLTIKDGDRVETVEGYDRKTLDDAIDQMLGIAPVDLLTGIPDKEVTPNAENIRENEGPVPPTGAVPEASEDEGGENLQQPSEAGAAASDAEAQVSRRIEQIKIRVRNLLGAVKGKQVKRSLSLREQQILDSLDKEAESLGFKRTGLHYTPIEAAPVQPPASTPVAPTAAADSPSGAAKQPWEMTAEEFNDALDALADERMALAEKRRGDDGRIHPPQDDTLEAAMSRATTPGLDFDRAIEGIKVAIAHGRNDVAKLIIERFRRSAEKPPSLPGVSKDNPKYESIKKTLSDKKAEELSNVKQLERLYEIRSGEKIAVGKRQEPQTPAPTTDIPSAPVPEDPSGRKKGDTVDVDGIPVRYDAPYVIEGKVIGHGYTILHPKKERKTSIILTQKMLASGVTIEDKVREKMKEYDAADKSGQTPATPAAPEPTAQGDLRGRLMAEIKKRLEKRPGSGIPIYELVVDIGYPRSEYGTTAKENPALAELLAMRDAGEIEVSDKEWGEPLIFSAKEAAVEAPAKQPWEMTKREYLAQDSGYQAALSDVESGVLPKSAFFGEKAWLIDHANQIKEALRSNLPVPRAVLEDYRGAPWADEALAKMDAPATTVPTATGAWKTLERGFPKEGDRARIKTRNGGIIEGTYVKWEEKHHLLKGKDGADIKVPMSHVSSIETFVEGAQPEATTTEENRDRYTTAQAIDFLREAKITKKRADATLKALRLEGKTTKEGRTQYFSKEDLVKARQKAMEEQGRERNKRKEAFLSNHRHRVWWHRLISKHGGLRPEGEFQNLLDSLTTKGKDGVRRYLPEVPNLFKIFNLKGGGLRFDELIDKLMGTIPDTLLPGRMLGGEGGLQGSSSNDQRDIENVENILIDFFVRHQTYSDTLEMAEDPNGTIAKLENNDETDADEEDIEGWINQEEDVYTRIEQKIEYKYPFISMEEVYALYETETDGGSPVAFKIRDLKQGDKFSIGSHEFTVKDVRGNGLKADDDPNIEIPFVDPDATIFADEAMIDGEDVRQKEEGENLVAPGEVPVEEKIEDTEHETWDAEETPPDKDTVVQREPVEDWDADEEEAEAKTDGEETKEPKTEMLSDEKEDDGARASIKQGDMFEDMLAGAKKEPEKPKAGEQTRLGLDIDRGKIVAREGDAVLRKKKKKIETLDHDVYSNDTEADEIEVVGSQGDLFGERASAKPLSGEAKVAIEDLAERVMRLAGATDLEISRMREQMWSHELSRGARMAYGSGLKGGLPVIGLYQPGPLRDLILFSNDATMDTATEEAGHYLFKRKLTRGEQIRLLQKYRTEEKAMDAFLEWRRGRLKATSPIQKIFQKILDVLNDIRAAWRASGYATPEALFSAMEREKIGKRQEKRARPKRQETAGEDARAMVAHHGTPHVFAPENGFPHGRFRLDKIGTGEGSQAFGWGIYFAENPEVAEVYKGRGEATDVENDGFSLIEQNMVKEMSRAEDRQDYDTAAVIEELLINRSPSQARARFADNPKRLGIIEKYAHRFKNDNSLYSLDIPDEVIPTLLDYDEDIRDVHGDAILSQIKKEKIRMYSLFKQDWDDKNTVWNGERIYGELLETFHSDKKASEFLARAGIPGLKFLDQGSRALEGEYVLTRNGKPITEEGNVLRYATREGAAEDQKTTYPDAKVEKKPQTYNYVIWDQGVLDQIVLLKRNGERLDQMLDDDARASIGGVNAKAVGNTAEAERMEKAGNSREEIWEETGWWRGPDGKWRFEIDDYDFEFKVSPFLKDINRKVDDLVRERMKNLGKKRMDELTEEEHNSLFDIRLSDVINHPQLFQAYPDFKDVDFAASPSLEHINIKGSFMETNPNTGRGRISLAVLLDLSKLPDEKDGEDFGDVLEKYEYDVAQSLIHEIQHAIQNKENFGRGGNPENSRFFKKEFEEAKERSRRIEAETGNYIPPDFEIYRRLSGEAEARLVSRRLNMPSEQRKAEPPWVTMEKMLREEGLLKEGQTPEDVMITQAAVGDDIRASVGKAPVTAEMDRAYLEAAGEAGIPEMVSKESRQVVGGTSKQREISESEFSSLVRMVSSGQMRSATIRRVYGHKIHKAVIDLVKRSASESSDLMGLPPIRGIGDVAKDAGSGGKVPSTKDIEDRWASVGKAPVTPEMDRAYMEAAKRGDTETARRMVDEAAKAAEGIKAFRGHEEGRNVYDTRLDTPTFTENEDVAKQYAEDNSENGTVSAAYLFMANPLRFGGDDAVITKEEFRRLANSLDPSLYEKVGSSGDWVFDGEALLFDDAPDGAYVETYYLANNPDMIDAAKGAGHDGFIYRGIYFSETFDKEPLEYRPFEQAQIKLADPITYDDAGNIIPLSERFNPMSDDARASVKKDLKAARTDGILSEEEAEQDDLFDAAEEDAAKSAAERIEDIDTGVNTKKQDFGAFKDLVLKSPFWFAKKVPAAKRLFRAAQQLNTVRHLYLSYILGESANDPDSEIASLQRFAKTSKEWYKKLSDYLIEKDIASDGLYVMDEGPGRFAVYDPRGENPVLVGIAADEESAWALAFLKEADEAMDKLGFDEETAKALINFRTINRRMYLVTRGTSRRIEEIYRRFGLEPPPVPDQDGKETPLIEAIEQMGQLSGSYMPRIWKAGGLVFRAHKKGEHSIRKHFKTEHGWKQEKKKWEKKGYFVEEMTKRDRPSEVAYMDAKWNAINDIVQNSITKLEKEFKRKNALEDYGMKWTFDEKTNDFVLSGDTGRHAETLKNLGGNYYGEAWHFKTDNAKAFKKSLEHDLITDSFKKELAESVGDNFTETIATVIKQRGSLARRIPRSTGVGLSVVKGYEEDPIRAMTAAATSVSGGAAKRLFSQQATLIISGYDVSFDDFAKDQFGEGYKDLSAKDQVALKRKYVEWARNRRIDSSQQENAYRWAKDFSENILRNENDWERIGATLRGLTAAKYLSGLAGPAVVNLTSMVTSFPAAMQHYGKINGAKTAKLMAEASRDYLKYALAVRRGQEPSGLSENARWLMGQIVDRYWDQAPFHAEATSAMQGEVKGAWGKVVKAITWTFSETEKFNRVVSIMSAYRGLTAGKTGLTEEQKEAFLEEAFDISNKAHGVFGKENLLDWTMGEKWTAIMARNWMVFRTYTHNYLQLMQDIGIKDPKSQFYLTVMPFILAGTSPVALPLKVAVKIAGFLIPGWEPPDEIEEGFYKWLDQHFGASAERFGRFGLAGLLGVSIKSSLAIGPDSVPSLTSNDPLTFTGQDIFGAPYSAVADVVNSLKMFRRGDIMKGAELLSPRILSGTVRAGRETFGGVTARWSNNPLIVDGQHVRPTGYETMLRVLNFNPGRLAGIQEKRWSKTQVRNKYATRREDIYVRVRDWANPSSPKDLDEWEKIRRMILNYNEAVVRRRPEGANLITDSTLKRVITNSQRGR